MKRIPVHALKKAPVSPAALIAPSSELISALIQWRTTVAVEKTKREEIAARRDVLLRSLENEREIMLTYIGRAFAERAEALRHFYEHLDRAVAEKNSDLLNAALSGIVSIVKESPLRDLAAFRRAREAGEVIDI